jgi:dihydrofolate reductase
VAASLDGFIAGPDGSYDWIVMDPAIDFTALYREFDTAVMGRKTYEAGLTMGGNFAMPGIEVVVFSRTLAPATHKGLRITNDAPASVVADLKNRKGRDIWLFGGGELFRSLLDAGLVDTVEIAVMPVLLGSGIPLLPAGHSASLVLSEVKRLSSSGIVVLAYAVRGTTARPPKVRYVASSRRKA